MPARPLTACVCCSSTALRPYLGLGEQPLANSYHHGETLPRYPLVANWCEACGHSQLSVAVEPDEMFQDYKYVSGTSASLREHFTSLAVDALRKYGYANPRILDIGCNDGTLLSRFKVEKECNVFGVEPALNLAMSTSKRLGFRVLGEYWAEAAATKLPQFDILTACNVLAHTAEPVAFLRACKLALAPDGLLVIEVPYVRDLIRQNAWDTIYHEHVSYFSVRSLNMAVLAAGLEVESVRRVPIHGGSLRVYVRHTGGLPVQELEPLKWRDYNNLALQAYIIKNNLAVEVCKQWKRGRIVVAFGASAKGSTLLNSVGKLPIDYIVDDNPLKHGWLTPGSNIEIKSPDVLEESPDRPLAVLMLAWNFAPEICEKIRRRRPGAGDVAIYYVPNVRTEAI